MLPAASFVMLTELRNVLIPPSLEIDLVFMYEEVSGAACTTFAPVSRF